jgi:hypothetical protein
LLGEATEGLAESFSVLIWQLVTSFYCNLCSGKGSEHMLLIFALFLSGNWKLATGNFPSERRKHAHLRNGQPVRYRGHNGQNCLC